MAFLLGKCNQICVKWVFLIAPFSPFPPVGFPVGQSLGQKVELLEWSNSSRVVIKCAVEKRICCLDLPAGVRCSEKQSLGLLVFQFRHLSEHVRDSCKFIYPGVLYTFFFKKKEKKRGVGGWGRRKHPNMEQKDDWHSNILPSFEYVVLTGHAPRHGNLNVFLSSVT